MFLFFPKSEPQRSYKHGSYKKIYVYHCVNANLFSPLQVLGNSRVYFQGACDGCLPQVLSHWSCSIVIEAPHYLDTHNMTNSCFPNHDNFHIRISFLGSGYDFLQKTDASSVPTNHRCSVHRFPLLLRRLRSHQLLRTRLLPHDFRLV